MLDRVIILSEVIAFRAMTSLRVVTLFRKILKPTIAQPDVFALSVNEGAVESALEIVAFTRNG